MMSTMKSRCLERFHLSATKMRPWKVERNKILRMMKIVMTKG